LSAALDSDLAQVLKILPHVDVGATTPQSFRDLMRALAAARAATPPPPVASVADLKDKGAETLLPARAYRQSSEVSPTVVFFHGGGWAGGDLETHDRAARLLAIETGAVVVSLDYRRPPETPFPGAFADALAAVRDVHARIGEFGKDPLRLGIAGDSAGGNLGAAAAIACRDEGLRLAAQLLVYPVTDAAGFYADARENARFPSRSENADGYFLSLAMMGWFARHYIADAKTSFDWRVSPLRAKSLAGVAPAILCTAFFDPLRDEGEAYGDGLAAAGVEVERHHGAGMMHGYFGRGDASPAARAEAARVPADFKALLVR
jgi:acetyl esterase